MTRKELMIKMSLAEHKFGRAQWTVKEIVKRWHELRGDDVPFPTKWDYADAADSLKSESEALGEAQMNANPRLHP